MDDPSNRQLFIDSIYQLLEIEDQIEKASLDMDSLHRENKDLKAMIASFLLKERDSSHPYLSKRMNIQQMEDLWLKLSSLIMFAFGVVEKYAKEHPQHDARLERLANELMEHLQDWRCDWAEWKNRLNADYRGTARLIAQHKQLKEEQQKREQNRESSAQRLVDVMESLQKLDKEKEALRAQMQNNAEQYRKNREALEESIQTAAAKEESLNSVIQQLSLQLEQQRNECDKLKVEVKILASDNQTLQDKVGGMEFGRKQDQRTVVLLGDQIEQQQVRHDGELLAMRAAHQTELERMRAELQRQQAAHNAELQRQQVAHQAELDRIRAEHAAKLKEQPFGNSFALNLRDMANEQKELEGRLQREQALSSELRAQVERMCGQGEHLLQRELDNTKTLLRKAQQDNATITVTKNILKRELDNTKRLLREAQRDNKAVASALVDDVNSISDELSRFAAELDTDIKYREEVHNQYFGELCEQNNLFFLQIKHMERNRGLSGLGVKKTQPNSLV